MQPPEGPPVCTALNFLPSGNAAADVIDDLPQGDAHGHFDQAGVVDLADQGEYLGALAARGADARRTSPQPLLMMWGTLAQVSTLLRLRGLVPQTALDRAHVLGAAARPTLPSSERISALDSPQTKAPPPRAMRTSKSKPDPRMSSPSRPYARACLERQREVLDGQRILVAHVDVALVAADGVGPDDHALQHQWGLPSSSASVHVRARVAFVRVADDVFRLAFRVAAAFPLATGGETGTAPAPQPERLTTSMISSGCIVVRAPGPTRCIRRERYSPRCRWGRSNRCRPG